MTCKITCFFEDIAHEQFICAVVRRLAKKNEIQIELSVRNAIHGSKMLLELVIYLKELKNQKECCPNILIVVRDGDCRRHQEVKREILEKTNSILKGSLPAIVCAIPEPHIERWYVEDQNAFKKVLPTTDLEKWQYRCEKVYYKRILKKAIQSTGVEPSLGGAEYGEDIGNFVDPRRMDDSFRAFWHELDNILIAQMR